MRSECTRRISYFFMLIERGDRDHDGEEERERGRVKGETGFSVF